MARWLRTLTLTPEWADAEAGKLLLGDMAGIIAARLEALEPIPTWQDLEATRSDLVDRFRGLAEELSPSEEDFNRAMDELYDWGNEHLEGAPAGGVKLCWIATIAIRQAGSL